MKVCTPTDLLAYIFLVTKVAEEFGGVNTAYQYDLLARKEMARAYENGDNSTAQWYFTNLDKDMAREAKDKASDAVSRANKKAAAHGKPGSSKGAPGSQSFHGKGGPKGNDRNQQDSKDKRQVTSPTRGRSRTPAGGDKGGKGGKGSKGGKGDSRSSWSGAEWGRGSSGW